MLTRRLGQTELEISRLGFGGWSAGGPAARYSGTAERDVEAVASMVHAVDHGVNWFDTSPLYGAGHSERLVGQALRKVGRGRAFVFTKCGRRRESDAGSYRSDLRPATIRADCEASLRRLGVDCIDVLQFHWPDFDTGVPIEESWGELLRLVDEGNVRVPGVCNFDIELLERCEAIGHVGSLQTPLSLIKRHSTGGLLDWCAAHSTGVVAYSPMQVGLLTDTFSAAAVAAFDAADWRREDAEFLPPRLNRNLALRDALKPIAARHDTSVAAIAVAWVLSWPQVSAAIVGARTRAQIGGWIGAAAVELSTTDLDEIAEVIRRTKAGSDA